MVDFSQADPWPVPHEEAMRKPELENRTIAVVGQSGALKDDVAGCLGALGAACVSLQWDAVTGPDIAGLKVEERVVEALERVEATLGDADAIVFVARDLHLGEDVPQFIEESIAGYHFCLKLGKRLRARAATDVIALASASARQEQLALAADIRNGALRQMSLVAASEGGPLDPPMLVNTLYVTGETGLGTSASLPAMLARLLRRPQGYVTGTTLGIEL